jgi:hypothetical protein
MRILSDKLQYFCIMNNLKQILYCLLPFVFLSSTMLRSQHIVPSSDSLIIFGEVEKPTTLALPSLSQFEKTIISDQIIYNHKGEIKDTLKGLQGINLKTLLKTIQLRYEKPKELNTMIFIFTATDGYKVVLSWSEIYNTSCGNHFYLITQMKGQPIEKMKDRLLFLASQDIKTGRRYIKGLQSIEIKRI